MGQHRRTRCALPRPTFPPHSRRAGGRAGALRAPLRPGGARVGARGRARLREPSPGNLVLIAPARAAGRSLARSSVRSFTALALAAARHPLSSPVGPGA